VEVRDTGCGVKPDIRKRIFDPFFTTKAPGSGTGLGLAVCHGIVTSLGGEIDLLSQLGQGTTFRVLLPVAAPEIVAPPPPAAEPGVAFARVLVVDDEPMVRNTLARMLSKDYTISVASDAQEALAMISRGERFDLILSDVSMAGMSGMELHDALAQRNADQALRMVFLSGGAFSGETIDFLRQMAHRHLEKPFALSQLRDLIREQLEKLGRCPREAAN